MNEVMNETNGMMNENIIKNLQYCRICNSTELTRVISLGEQYITSRFPKYGDFSTPKTPIDLCVCENPECRLLQLYQTTNSSELYEHEYGYRSGISNTMKQHLKDYQEEILSKVSLNIGDTIVDIGSNDSTMLQYYSNTLNRIGVDPTGKQFSHYYGSCKLLPTYFNLNNFRNEFDNIKCKVVSSISMFYDLPEPVTFARDIYEILDDEGIWTCEQSYLMDMLKTNSIDTICHEHLEYYSMKQIKYIADKAGFKIIDVKFNACNGGSFRIYFAKQSSTQHRECSELIDEILLKEEWFGLNDNNVFIHFMTNCNNEISYLINFLNTVNRNGKKTYIYGASTKGNCLLQYANIGEDIIKYAVERNPRKVGKMTNTGIEIISEETMRESPPDYLLVLPWHFKTEILEREKEFLDNGGQFIFPFPNFEIVSSKPKVLITGCDGMIASYLKEQLSDLYTLYGISRNLISQTNQSNQTNNIMKFTFDMNNLHQLTSCILTVKPDIIVHLASISSSQYAYEHPVETLMTNGMLTATLCDIIHKQGLKTKLFNASSSEIYKGHVDYLVKEDDTHKYHLHPYSIAKTMGQSMVDFYRTTYGLPFSNGILFTTESERKRPEFLLNKVKQHVKLWNESGKESKKPLRVSNLDSYRNILHASDVAIAISIIIQQPIGDDYLICNDYSVKVYDLVLQIYSNNGISLMKIDDNTETTNDKDTIFYDNETGLECLIIENNKNQKNQQNQKIQGNKGFDTTPTNIRGECVKLKQLGWKPKIEINDLL
jgi:GDP-mannose 4,6-dehydratase